MYAFLDPFGCLSFVSPHMTIRFDMSPKLLLEACSDYTFVIYLVLSKRVYRNSLVLLFHKVTSCCLAELKMTTFDVILGIDKLHECYH